MRGWLALLRRCDSVALMMSLASAAKSNGRHMCVLAAVEEVGEWDSVEVFRLHEQKQGDSFVCLS